MLYAHARQEINSLFQTSIKHVLEEVGRHQSADPTVSNPTLVQQFWGEVKEDASFYANFLNLGDNTAEMITGLDIPASIHYWEGQKFQHQEVEEPKLMPQEAEAYSNSLRWIAQEQKTLLNSYNHLWTAMKPNTMERAQWMGLIVWLGEQEERIIEELLHECDKNPFTAWLSRNPVWKDLEAQLPSVRGRAQLVSALKAAVTALPHMQKLDQQTNKTYEVFWQEQQNKITHERKKRIHKDRLRQYEMHNSYIQMIINQLMNEDIGIDIDTINGVGVLLTNLYNSEWMGWERIAEIAEMSPHILPSYLSSISMMMTNPELSELKMN